MDEIICKKDPFCPPWLLVNLGYAFCDPTFPENLPLFADLLQDYHLGSTSATSTNTSNRMRSSKAKRVDKRFEKPFKISLESMIMETQISRVTVQSRRILLKFALDNKLINHQGVSLAQHLLEDISRSGSLFPKINITFMENPNGTIVWPSAQPVTISEGSSAITTHVDCLATAIPPHGVGRLQVSVRSRGVGSHVRSDLSSFELQGFRLVAMSFCLSTVKRPSCKFVCRFACWTDPKTLFSNLQIRKRRCWFEDNDSEHLVAEQVQGDRKVTLNARCSNWSR